MSGRRSSHLNHDTDSSDRRILIASRNNNAQFAGLDFGWLAVEYDEVLRKVRARLYAQKNDVAPVAQSAEIVTGALPSSVALAEVSSSGVSGTVTISGVTGTASNVVIGTLVVTGIGRTAATLSFSVSPAANARIYWRTNTGPGAWQDSGLRGVTTAHSYQITGLTQSTLYDIYLVADEGGAGETESPLGAPASGLFHALTTADAGGNGGTFEFENEDA